MSEHADTPLAVQLDRLATRYFGDEWAQPVAHFCKINARTLQRIRQAARDGVDHKSAAGVIAALTEALPDFATGLAEMRARH